MNSLTDIVIWILTELHDELFAPGSHHGMNFETCRYPGCVAAKEFIASEKQWEEQERQRILEERARESVTSPPEETR